MNDLTLINLNVVSFMGTGCFIIRFSNGVEK